jgi:hypothetical protein
MPGIKKGTMFRWRIVPVSSACSGTRLNGINMQLHPRMHSFISVTEHGGYHALGFVSGTVAGHYYFGIEFLQMVHCLFYGFIVRIYQVKPSNYSVHFVYSCYVD